MLALRSVLFHQGQIVTYRNSTLHRRYHSDNLFCSLFILSFMLECKYNAILILQKVTQALEDDMRCDLGERIAYPTGD